MILFIAMVNYAHADTGREDAEGLRAGVVLEAGEIDSSTVEVGVLAVVVHMGKGDGIRSSRKWELSGYDKGLHSICRRRRC